MRNALLRIVNERISSIKEEIKHGSSTENDKNDNHNSSLDRNERRSRIT